MNFASADSYIMDDHLSRIVDVAVRLELPLLVKGEPGTGKTLLAHAMADHLKMPLVILNVKSSMKAVEALYIYDTLTRLNDSRFGDSGRDVAQIDQYIRMGKIGQSFEADEKTVLLIDEIDKADSDFQDDLLDVLDQMSFDILEVDRTVRSKHRPVVVITSNAKKDLSDPFLGRCIFHHIAFPDPSFMERIVASHFPDLHGKLARKTVEAFYRLREIEGTEKLPATRELLHWIQALQGEPGFDLEHLHDDRKIPLLGLLFKKTEDLFRAQYALGQIRR